MSESAAPLRPELFVDPVAVRQQAARLSRADTAPWLHAEVARRMAERLDIIKLKPSLILNWGADLSASIELLQQAYPEAQQWLVDRWAVQQQRNLQRLQRPWWRRLGGQARLSALSAVNVPDAQAQMLWANLNLHASEDVQALLRRWQQWLAVDGFVMFSCLGPDSLRELRELYAELGWGLPMPAWQDMHDIGDQMVEAGFADPVMDQERLTLTWADSAALLKDLRALGGNTAPSRHTGLRTPRWRARLEQALQQRLGDGGSGRLCLTLELVYGHAFKPQARARVASETSIGLDQMRAMVRGTRTPR